MATAADESRRLRTFACILPLPRRSTCARTNPLLIVKIGAQTTSLLFRDML